MRTVLLVLLVLLLAAIVAGFLLIYAPDKDRAALEARYAAPPSQFREALGIRLHLRDTGPRDAPPVLFLHGFGSSLHTWEEVARGLEDRHRVIRLDLPGFGLSAGDPGRDYSDARSFAVILAMLDGLGVRGPVDVIGSSMGGRVAWGLAAAHPDRVRRLVLMAPDGYRSPGREYGQRPKAPWWAAVGLRLFPHVMPEFLLRKMLRNTYGDPAVLTDDLFARYRDMLLAPGVRRAILDRAKDSVLLPPEERLRSIRAPTLLLWGEADRLVPVTNAADYRRELRDSRAVILPGIGHVPMEEAPAATVAALRDFLQGP